MSKQIDLSGRKLPKAGTANWKILDHLIKHGEITTLQVRAWGLSGNPSQRWSELTDDYGFQIDRELCHTEDGRPYSRWVFQGFRDSQGVPEESAPRPAATANTDGASSSPCAPSGSLPSASVRGDQSTNNRSLVTEASDAGCGQLFELDPVVPGPVSHFRSEAA